MNHYPVIQVSGGKFHRTNITAPEPVQWFRDSIPTHCGRSAPAINVFESADKALDYTGRRTAHFCKQCFPDL